MKLNTLVLATSLSLASVSAFASTSEKVEFDQIVQQADTVVIVQKHSSEQINRDGVIITRTKFDVIESGFGNNENQIFVETLGGSLNHMKYPVSQAGANNILFLKNQPILLMLNKKENGAFSITKQQQGMYPISNNKVLLPSNKGGSLSIDDALNVLRNIQTSPKP